MGACAAGGRRGLRVTGYDDARDTPIAGEEPPSRFATGGPDAEELGASIGYPKGNRATFWRIRSQVGSFSHLDELFRGRLIHKASMPSRLVRVVEPRSPGRSGARA